MKKCLYADQIDDYLFNKLEGGAREQFEEHYFNCPDCFREMEERETVISTIKSRGAWIFKPESVPAQRHWVPAWKRAVASFAPRQWATVGVAAAALLFVVLGVLPRFRSAGPEFVLSDTEVVRGESLTLMSPIIDVRSVPTFFEWKSLAQDVEYKISL
jgi:anti-sigma factor RsiW